MAKDVNIHVKVEGAQQVQQDLQGVNRDVNKLGDNVEQMGSRSSRALEWFGDGIRSLAGPIGFAALIGAVSSVAGKISQFFDDFKSRCDEVVGKLQSVRKGFESVFEAMDAFDEKSRKQVTTGTIDLLKKTSVSQEVGLPVISQYARQFKGLVQSGELSPEQYQQGLEGMLGYAARHGKAATPELITLMAAQGMKTPEQQGAFRRQIGAVSKNTGLTEEEIIDILGRSASTANAMGWKPEEALNYVGIIAAGEVGRKKLTLPSTTLETLVNPQTANLKEYGITPQQAQDPAQLLRLLAVKQKTMDEKSVGRMLREIYGPEAALGVYKLLKTPPGGKMASDIKWAATPQAAAAEAGEELTSRKTRERQQALTDIVKTEEWTKGDPFFYKTQIRQLGKEKQETLQIEHPFYQWFRENIRPETVGLGFIPNYFLTPKTITEGKKKEDAAFVRWLQNLSPEERERILSETKAPTHVGPIPLISQTSREIFQLQNYYKSLTPEQQYQGVVGDTHLHYEHITNYYPSVGDNLRGPRFGRDDF